MQTLHVLNPFKEVGEMFEYTENRSFFFALVAIYAASALIAKVSVAIAGVAT